MSHRFGRRRLITPLVIGAMAVAPIATARASDASLRASVKRAVPTIRRSQAKINAAQATLRRTHSTTKLFSAVRVQDTALGNLRTTLQGESSSTSTGAKGKADIVKGLGLIVDSNRALVKDIKKESLGTKVSQASLNALVRGDRRGSALFVAGAKLLGL